MIGSDMVQLTSLQKRGDHTCTASHLHIHPLMHQYRTESEEGEGIELSKFYSTPSALASCGSTLPDTMRTMVNYTGRFNLKTREKIVEALLKDLWLTLCPLNIQQQELEQHMCNIYNSPSCV